MDSKIDIVSEDGQVFSTTRESMSKSTLLRDMMEMMDEERVLTVATVSGAELGPIIRFCENPDMSLDDLLGCPGRMTEVLPGFMKVRLGANVVPTVAARCDGGRPQAANFLGVEQFLDLTCQRMADIIAHKTPEQIREMFQIEDDLTEEEKAEVREENSWLFST